MVLDVSDFDRSAVLPVGRLHAGSGHDRHPSRPQVASEANGVPLAARLTTAGLAEGVAHDLVARYPARQIGDALDVLTARPNAAPAGWLVQAISEAWLLHDEAARIRATRHRKRQREAIERAERAAQEQRDRRLAGWAAAISDALPDARLAAAVERITSPVGGLDRRSAPLAASQLLAWAINGRPRDPRPHSPTTDRRSKQQRRISRPRQTRHPDPRSSTSHSSPES